MIRRATPTVLFALSALAVAPALAGDNLAKDINWVADIDEAHKQATASNKPMLIVFGADWCGYCKKLEKTTLSHPQMVQYVNRDFIPVHLDLDEERKIAKILEVDTLPNTVVLSPEADLLGRIVGYEGPSRFYQKLVAAQRLGANVKQASGEGATQR